MMFRCLLLWLLAPLCWAASITTTPLTIRDIPAGITIKGRFQQGLRWQDQSGANLVILSSEIQGRDDDDMLRGHVYAGQWRQTDGQWQLVWKLMDKVDACPLDMFCEFLPKALEITDLDGNGTAEVSLMYRLACLGGVDPAELKLMLYENQQKYALRGEEKLLTYDLKGKLVGSVGGQMTADKAFNSAPPAFLEFAKRKWQRLSPRKVGD